MSTRAAKSESGPSWKKSIALVLSSVYGSLSLLVSAPSSSPARPRASIPYIMTGTRP